MILILSHGQQISNTHLMRASVVIELTEVPDIESILEGKGEQKFRVVKHRRLIQHMEWESMDHLPHYIQTYYDYYKQNPHLSREPNTLKEE